MDSQIFIDKVLALKALGGHPRFYDLLLEIAELHARKTLDYAHESDPLSNLKRSVRIGIPPYKATISRMQDKWSRIEELSKKEAHVAGESILDSFKDNAVYSLLAHILYEENTSLDK